MALRSRTASFRLAPDRKPILSQQSIEIVEEKTEKKSSKKSSKKTDPEQPETAPVESTPIHRHPNAKDKLLTSPSDDIKNLSDVFQTAVAKYADRPALGMRPKKADGTLGDYVWLKWSEVGLRVKNFGAGLRSVCGLSLDSKVGIYAKNRIEWVLSAEAAHAHGFVTVALYDTFGAENLTYVINHSELTTVIGSLDRIQNLLQLIDQCPNVKHLVTMDVDDEDKISVLRKLALKHNIHLYTVPELEAKGAEVADKKKFKPVSVDIDHLAVIMYTSGTTGAPKGAMITHGNLVSVLSAVGPCLGGFFETDVYISYLPLAHVFERVSVAAVMAAGGCIGFYGGDVTKLVDDMAALKPTLMAAAPRVLNRIYQKINDGVSHQNAVKRSIFKKGLKSKSKSILEHKDSSAFDFVFKKPKSLVGGRLRIILSGSAPLTAEVQKFVRTVFGCPVVQGYGLTETCAGGCVVLIDDVDCIGEVGPPLPACEIKLVSVPELNYLAKNNQGEVWIRGPNVCKGYYKDPKKTAEDFDEDGWFHSGDVGEFTSRGTLKIIDRKKNIFKLSQGEYVAVEVLENLYSKSPFVDQIWIHGDSTQSALVAVVNLNKAYVRSWADRSKVPLSNPENAAHELVDDDALRAAVLEDLARLAKAEKRQGFEFVKRVHMIDYEFSTENDFATPTAKLKRPQLKAAFKAEIDAMYKQINDEANGIVSPPTTKDKGKGKDKGKEPSDKAAPEKVESESESSESEEKTPKKSAQKVADSESDGDFPTESGVSESSESSAEAPKQSTPTAVPTKQAESSEDSDAETSEEQKEAPAPKKEEPKKEKSKTKEPKKEEPKKEESKKENSKKQESKKEKSKKEEPKEEAKQEKSPKSAPAKKADSSKSSAEEEKKSAPAKKSKKAAKQASSSSSSEESS